MKRLTLSLALVSLMLMPAVSQAAVGPAVGNLAFVRNNNLVLFLPAAGRTRQITFDATGYTPQKTVNYPYHAWSPDGQYLLAVKVVMEPGHDYRAQMLLFDAQGRLLRSLGRLQYPSDFNPGWAVDANVIAYTAWSRVRNQQLGFYHAVNRIDVAGHTSFLLGYNSPEGCGGGTGDPATQMFWQETGFGSITTTMQWSTRSHVLLHSGSCGGGLFLVNTRTQSSRFLGDQRSQHFWDEAVLSSTGRLAAVKNTVHANRLVTHVALVDPVTGAVTRVLGPGELPAWSPDGQALYYERRTPGRALAFRDALGNHIGSQTYRSAIWRADSPGLHQVRLLVQDAFGFGPINVARDNHTLIFSRVDNAWKLFRAYQAGGLTDMQARLLRPQVRIEQLDPGIGVTTLFANAGRPAIQP